MAKSTALVSTLLLAALAATASAEPIRAANDVNTACDFVTVPQLCTSLITKTAPATVRDLTLASIKEAMSTADNAKATAEKVKSEQASNKKLTSGLDVCTRVFDQAKEALQKASVNMDANDGYNDVVAEITAAVTYVGACNDIFSENPGMVSPVADVTSILKKLIGNSLALSVALQVQAKKQQQQH